MANKEEALNNTILEHSEEIFRRMRGKFNQINKTYLDIKNEIRECALKEKLIRNRIAEIKLKKDKIKSRILEELEASKGKRKLQAFIEAFNYCMDLNKKEAIAKSKILLKEESTILCTEFLIYKTNQLKHEREAIRIRDQAASLAKSSVKQYRQMLEVSKKDEFNLQSNKSKVLSSNIMINRINISKTITHMLQNAKKIVGVEEAAIRNIKELRVEVAESFEVICYFESKTAKTENEKQAAQNTTMKKGAQTASKTNMNNKTPLVSNSSIDSQRISGLVQSTIISNIKEKPLGVAPIIEANAQTYDEPQALSIINPRTHIQSQTTQENSPQVNEVQRLQVQPEPIPLDLENFNVEDQSSANIVPIDPVEMKINSSTLQSKIPNAETNEGELALKENKALQKKEAKEKLLQEAEKKRLSEQKSRQLKLLINKWVCSILKSCQEKQSSILKSKRKEEELAKAYIVPLKEVKFAARSSFSEGQSIIKEKIPIIINKEILSSCSSLVDEALRLAFEKRAIKVQEIQKLIKFNKEAAESLIDDLQSKNYDIINPEPYFSTKSRDTLAKYDEIEKKLKQMAENSNEIKMMTTSLQEKTNKIKEEVADFQAENKEMSKPLAKEGEGTEEKVKIKKKTIKKVIKTKVKKEKKENIVNKSNSLSIQSYTLRSYIFSDQSNRERDSDSSSDDEQFLGRTRQRVNTAQNVNYSHNLGTKIMFETSNSIQSEEMYTNKSTALNVINRSSKPVNEVQVKNILANLNVIPEENECPSRRPEEKRSGEIKKAPTSDVTEQKVPVKAVLIAPVPCINIEEVNKKLSFINSIETPESETVDIKNQPNIFIPPDLYNTEESENDFQKYMDIGNKLKSMALESQRLDADMKSMTNNIKVIFQNES